jgi:hypothetical protein
MDLRGGFTMQAKQEIINIIDVLPQNIIEEIYHYASYLKAQSEKEARNAAYIEKIERGIKQCAEGRGLVRDIIEVDEDE